jgi:hypothetical protein
MPDAKASFKYLPKMLPLSQMIKNIKLMWNSLRVSGVPASSIAFAPNLY